MKEKLARFTEEYDSLNLENSTLQEFTDLTKKFENYHDTKSNALKDDCKGFLENDLKVLRDRLQELIEKYKFKRQLVGDCRKE